MNSLHFEGKPLGLLKIRIVKFISSLITLGLLHPWGKIRELRYLYKNTYYEGAPFSFNGGLRDFYKGFFKFWLSIVLILALCLAGAYLVSTNITSPFVNTIYSVTVLICTLLSIYIEGLTINGSLSYKINNTSWGTVSLGYTGKPRELGSMFLINGSLTMLTIGLYNPWYFVKTFRYILKNLKFGNIDFEFTGDPKKLFIIHLKGCIFTILTLGIYSIWFTKKIYEFILDNILLKKGEQEVKLVSNANSLEVFELLIGNLLIVIFTLGFGYSWAKVRLLRFIANHSIIPQGIVPESTGSAYPPQSFLNLTV